MKVLHIYKTYYPESLGGVEETIHSLSQNLLQAGVTSDVVSTTSKKQAYNYSIACNEIKFFPRTIEKFSCPISIDLFRHFHKITKNYDILHFHFPWPFADLLYLFKGMNKPSVLTYHSDIVKQKKLNIFYQPLMRQFLKKIHRIVTTSDNLLQNSPVLSQFKHKTTIIPIGLELPKPPENAESRLAYWKQKCPAPFFLFVGILRYYKGLNFLLEAVRDSGIAVVIAGDGPESAHLHELAQRYQLKNVNFVGRVSEEDKWALLELCHAVVAPSHLKTEAFCISLLEGLSHNKPLISTELGTGTSFVNTNNLTGIVVPPKNPAALKDAMLTLLNDKPYYEKLQKAVLPHYNKFFTGQRMGESYLQLYQALLENIK